MRKNKINRPLLAYKGGKFRIAEWILSFMPPHKIYCEPFGGAASILLAKQRASCEIYNDLDGRVVNVFRVMQDRTKASELKYRLRYTPYSRNEFDKAYESPKDDIDAARQTIIKSFMGIGAKGACSSGRTGFYCKIRKDCCSNTNAWINYTDCIEAFCNRLQGVIIENKDAVELIESADNPHTLFYIDPPYMPETWNSHSGYEKKADQNYHVRLLEVLKNVKGMVMLSGYDNEFYVNELSAWKREKKLTTNVRSEKREEYLWMNQNCFRLQRKTLLPL